MKIEGLEMPSMQLKDVRLKSLDFNINSGYKPKDGPQGFGFEVSVGGGFIEADKDLVVELCVRVPDENTPNAPFYIKIVYAGLFRFDESIDEKLSEYFKNVNCPAIIFPYLRETVADITRRAGFPPFHLPTVNFVKMSGVDNNDKPPSAPKKKATKGKGKAKKADK